MELVLDRSHVRGRQTTVQPYLWAVLGLILCSITGYYNNGIIAMDDYATVMGRIVPAQAQSFEALIEAAGIRSPVATLILLSFSKLIHSFGVDSPVQQLRWLLLLLGAFSFSVHAFVGIRLWNGDSAKATVAVFLLGFYFACPLLLSRPMIESLSAPFVSLSAYFACRYWEGRWLRSLFWAVLFAAIGFCFRFQVGVVYVALILMVFLGGNTRHVMVGVGLGVLAYIGIGGIDYFIRGEFNGSLWKYLSYNLEHSSGYGVSPFYTYGLLLFGLTIPPAFFSRYQNFSVREQYQSLFPLVLYFLFFVGAHSMVPHKEERFMIPILPIFLYLLVPLAVYLIFQLRAKWRVAYFLLINFFLLFFATTNVPQQNVIGVAEYVDRHPQITKLLAMEEALILFPGAFVRHPVKIERPIEVPAPATVACDSLVAIQSQLRPRVAETLKGYSRVQVFSPGLLESWVIRLNPKNNSRRGPIELYQPGHCVGR